MRSIRFQFLAFIAAILLILLLLLNTYPLTSSRDTVFEEKKNAMTSQAASISSSLASLDKLDSQTIAEVLALLDISGYSRTLVVDADGLTLYDDGGGTAGTPAQIDELGIALTGKAVFRSDFDQNTFSSCCAMPMSNQGEISGAVYILENDPERARLIVRIQDRIRNISLAISATVLILALIFSELVLRRLQELVHSMRIVASGNYGHRLTLRGQDEITELGNEFNLLTERLEDNEQQRRRFVSDASHELKTPLASIRLLADSIVQTDDIDVNTVREFVSDIGSETERLQRTTEKLLDLSRLDDDVQIVPEPVDVKQVAVDALVLLRPLAAEKLVHLKCDLPDGCVVMATVDDMFHIIFNLVENAIKYNVPDGSVFLSVHSDETTVQLTVEDTGIGIPEEDMLNVFARFYRVDKARSREAGGSGLGLSIVHDAVTTHGGTIAVGQNKPQGSRFIVTFPRPTSEETGI